MSAIPRSLTRFASTSAVTSSRPKIVVIGGGAGGLAAANQIYNTLKSQNQTLGDKDITIVDPASTHDYQPGWTVVGSGLAKKEKFRRSMDSLIPSYFEHVKLGAKGFEPGDNKVVLSDGSKLGYDYLVVAAGLQINWDNIKGLTNAISNPAQSKVSSIYSYETADKTWDLIRDFKQGQGEAIFTQPFGPVKCAGAPQKMAYMANSTWKSTNTPIKSSFITGMPTMFAVPKYSAALNEIRQQKGIDAEFNTNLVEVKADSKTAIFEILAGEKKGEKIEKEFGFLHVVPPMGALNWIKSSPLADGAGWVDVDQGTLQHKKFENVFALGDCSSLPTSKTAAAITAQTPVLSHNLVSHIQTGKVGEAIYDGYTSCPLFTGHGELLLAEFKYGGQPKETFARFVDQAKPNRAFYHLTKDVFPAVYFSQMLKGQWFGPKGLFPPQFIPS